MTESNEKVTPIGAPNNNIVFKIWRGEKSLRFTFWVVFFVPCLFLGTAVRNPTYQLGAIFYLLAVAYYLYASIAAWRSAQKTSTNNFDAGLAMILIGAGWLMNGYSLLQILFAAMKG
jgi:hypothetical protein